MAELLEYARTQGPIYDRCRTAANRHRPIISKKEQKELELYSRLADLEEDSGIQRLFIEQMHAVREHIRSLEDDFAHVTFVGAL